MSSIKNTTIFVNHEYKFNHKLKKNLPVITSMRIKFGIHNEYGTDFQPCDGKNIFKELTEIGLGARTSHGKAIRSRIKNVMAVYSHVLESFQYAVINKNNKVRIVFTNLGKIKDKYTGLVVVFDMDVSGSRANIEVHDEYITRKFTPLGKGNMSMTHNLCTMKQENRGGNRANKINTTVNETSSLVENNIATAEVIEKYNESVDIINATAVQMEKVTDAFDFIEFMKKNNPEFVAQYAAFEAEKEAAHQADTESFEQLLDGGL